MCRASGRALWRAPPGLGSWPIWVTIPRVEQDFYGLCVCGRTCTGQAIYMDSDIRRIVEELG